MIRLPNKFKGNNIMLEVKLDKEVDASILYPDVKSLDQELFRQLQSVESFYLTFSDMYSEINETNEIFYTEIIFKIPVCIGENFYIFPVVSYVSNPYSLIRGFYLGFHKELECNYVFDDVEIRFSREGVCEFNFEFKTQNCLLTTELPKECSYPLILFNNSNLVKNYSKYTLLEIDKYELEYRNIFEFPEISIGSFLGSKAKSNRVIFSRDKFQINGIKNMEVN